MEQPGQIVFSNLREYMIRVGSPSNVVEANVDHAVVIQVVGAQDAEDAVLDDGTRNGVVDFSHPKLIGNQRRISQRSAHGSSLGNAIPVKLDRWGEHQGRKCLLERRGRDAASDREIASGRQIRFFKRICVVRIDGEAHLTSGRIGVLGDTIHLDASCHVSAIWHGCVVDFALEK